jgi:hypothetical protein
MGGFTFQPRRVRFRAGLTRRFWIVDVFFTLELILTWTTSPNQVQFRKQGVSANLKGPSSSMLREPRIHFLA